MSEYKLSDRIRSGTDIMQRIAGGQRPALIELSDEVAALEAKLEAMEPIYTAASGLAVAIESFEGDDIDEVTRQWLEELLKALAGAQKE